MTGYRSLKADSFYSPEALTVMLLSVCLWKLILI